MIKRLLIIQSIVIVLLVFLLTIYARDEFHDQDRDQDHLENESFVLNGNKLSLSEATQNLIGLRVQKIKSTVYAFDREFPGVIMPVTELIEAQRDTKILNLAISETSSRLNQKKQDLSRILNLFQAGKKASSRQLELAELEVEENEKVLKKLIEEKDFLKLKIMATWSENISEMLGSENLSFISILNKKTQIARFAIRDKIQIKNVKWWVNKVGEEPENRIEAQLMGNAGSTIIGDIGEAWLVESRSLNLPSNSPVLVIAESSKKFDGVEVPTDSVVRYAGKSWIYLQTQNDEFERKNISENFPTSTGFFTNEITVGEVIVTEGAQTLLSEELKHLITNENED